MALENFSDKIIWRYDAGWDTFERAKYAKAFEDERGYEPDEEELNDYIDWMNQLDWDDMIAEVQTYERMHGEQQYIILARLGHWSGTYDGGSIITGLEKTIYECIRGCDFYTLAYKHNQFVIVAHHHDGTNYFRIKELKDVGKDYIERNEHRLSDRELHKKLFNHARYSAKVSLFPKVYGWG